jgi:hypothetical protein
MKYINDSRIYKSPESRILVMNIQTDTEQKQIGEVEENQAFIYL